MPLPEPDLKYRSETAEDALLRHGLYDETFVRRRLRKLGYQLTRREEAASTKTRR